MKTITRHSKPIDQEIGKRQFIWSWFIRIQFNREHDSQNEDWKRLMLIMLNKILFRLRQGILLCPENCSYQQENRWESAKQRYILKSIYIPFPFYEKRKKFSGQFKICTRQAIVGLGSDTNMLLITFWLFLFILDFAIPFWSPQHMFSNER